jgi:tetratricopeptide (TPR) repeat protein
MLKPNLPEGQTSLAIPSAEVEVVLADDESDPLAFVLSPTEDLDAIRSLKLAHHSISEVFGKDTTRFADAFDLGFQREKQKLDRYARSATFLNRLANLAGAAGKHDEETRFVERAAEIDSDSFFVHRLGDNLVYQNLSTEAERLFSQLNLAEDLDANLKLATFAVRRRDLKSAADYIERAVSIDPSSFAARLFEGGLCLARGEWDRAVHSFRLAAEDRPTSSVLFCNLALAYIRLNQSEKALVSLKRSVALGPLNENAILLFADFSFEQGIPEEAVPSLRYFLTLEQNNAGVWRRLARALLQIGKIPEAIQALRSEASVAESTDVWNSLGVAYLRLGERERSLRAFKHAIGLGAEDRDQGYYLACLNVAQQLSNTTANQKLLAFTRSLVADDVGGACLRDPVLSDIYAFYLFALGRTDQIQVQRAEAERILSKDSVAESLKAWIFSTLAASYTLHKDATHHSLDFIQRYRDRIDSLSGEIRDRDLMVYNNVAFALAESNQLGEAEKYLSRISRSVHRDPYATATFGLVDMRKGHVERGVKRYREAISLASNRLVKERIRQKLNLELGRFWASRSPPKARRYLERVVSAKQGEPSFREEAQEHLRALESN